jgi:hypothetical protein
MAEPEKTEPKKYVPTDVPFRRRVVYPAQMEHRRNPRRPSRADPARSVDRGARLIMWQMPLMPIAP